MTSAPPKNPFLDLLRRVKSAVDAELDHVLAGETQSYGPLGDEVQWMLESATTLCRGGKRLRAGLIAAGYQIASGRSDVPERVITAGVAAELLQSYFLVHDDWMDQDNTRRGNLTVHVELAHRFDDVHLGACGSVLAGDFLVALAHREFHRVALGHSQAAALLSEFTKMQLAAVVGQQLDVIGRTRNALSVYELKTGSYTVSGPLCIGALLGGAPVSTLSALSEFALPAGVAFQLRDDLLNLFAAPDQTGKPRGSDITAGKWTWTAQWLKRHADGQSLEHFERAFGKRDASPAELEAALEAVHDSGARAATEAFISERERESHSALAKLDRQMELTPDGVELLGAAVVALLHRGA